MERSWGPSVPSPAPRAPCGRSWGRLTDSLARNDKCWGVRITEGCAGRCREQVDDMVAVEPGGHGLQRRTPPKLEEWVAATAGVTSD